MTRLFATTAGVVASRSSIRVDTRFVTAVGVMFGSKLEPGCPGPPAHCSQSQPAATITNAAISATVRARLVIPMPSPSQPGTGPDPLTAGADHATRCVRAPKSDHG